MSSVVLDFDISIRYSSLYWEKLRSSDAVKACFGAEDGHGRRISFPLAYYNKDLWLGKDRDCINGLLKELEESKNTHVYSSEVLSKICEFGFELPLKNQPYCADFSKEILTKSLALIKDVWPAAHHEIMSYMCGCIVIDSEQTRSLTSPGWFGGIFLGHTLFSRNDLVEITTSIIHETGHLALFASSSISSPLEDLTSEFFSPFKQKDRPAYMVLHAQIALARMIMWLSCLKSHAKNSSSALIDTGRIRRFLEEFSSQYLEGMKSMENLAFTADGRGLLEDFRSIENLLRKAQP